MELQYELMVFTLFICLGAGIFAVQGLLAFLGKGLPLQMPALICSLMSIVVGGIGSFLHLQHWERIFNGFGHLTSGITQELIAVVVFVAALVVYFVVLRRSDGSAPKWAGIMAMAVSAVLVVVMAHSYNMASRPVWDTLLLWLYYLANTAFFGSLAIACIAGAKGGVPVPGAGSGLPGAGVDAVAVGTAAAPADDGSAALVAWAAQASGIVSALATAAYAAFFTMAASAFTSVGNYFDPTQATRAMADPQGVFASVFSGDYALLFWLGVVMIGLAVPLVLSFLMKGKSGAVLAGYSGIGLVCALAGGMCFRVVLYVLGFSVFMFY